MSFMVKPRICCPLFWPFVVCSAALKWKNPAVCCNVRFCKGHEWGRCGQEPVWLSLQVVHHSDKLELETVFSSSGLVYQLMIFSLVLPSPPVSTMWFRDKHEAPCSCLGNEGGEHGSQPPSEICQSSAGGGNRVRCSRDHVWVCRVCSASFPATSIDTSATLFIWVISHQVCGHIYYTKSLRFLPHQRRDVHVPIADSGSWGSDHQGDIAPTPMTPPAGGGPTGRSAEWLW